MCAAATAASAGSAASANAAPPRDVDVVQDKFDISPHKLQLPTSAFSLDYMSFNVSDNDVVEFVQLVKAAGCSFARTPNLLVLIRIALSHEYAWLALRRAWSDLWHASLSGIVMRFVANRFTRLKIPDVSHIPNTLVTFGVLHGICTERTQVGIARRRVDGPVNRWTVFLMEFGDLAPTRQFGIPAAVQVQEVPRGYQICLAWNRTELASTDIIQFLIPTDDMPTGNSHEEGLNPASRNYRCQKCGLTRPDGVVVFGTASDEHFQEAKMCIKCDRMAYHSLLDPHFLDVKNLSEGALVEMYASLICPQSDDNDDAACYPTRGFAKAYADRGNTSFPAPWYTSLRERVRERKRQDALYGPPQRQDQRDVLDYIMCKKPERRSLRKTYYPVKRARLESD